MGDLHIPVWFVIVELFDVNVIRKTICLNKYMPWRFSISVKIVTVYSAPVAIPETGKQGKVTKTLSSEEPIYELDEHATIQVAKFRNIPEEIGQLEIVVTCSWGLMNIEWILKAKSDKNDTRHLRRALSMC